MAFVIIAVIKRQIWYLVKVYHWYAFGLDEIMHINGKCNICIEKCHYLLLKIMVKLIHQANKALIQGGKV
ncbi:hypothetical protein C0033_25740 [Clostridium sp. chh4-2]|nr:hypothetical protein C0033_25740 [Clostridium sp. chh4-2]